MGVKLGLSHRFREFESWDYREEVTGDWGGLHSEEWDYREEVTGDWGGLHSEELGGLDCSQNINWGGQIKQHVYGEGKCLHDSGGKT